MNEKNITDTWNDADDAPKLTGDWFAGAELRKGDEVVRRGRPPTINPKKAVSLRLDPDVVEWFRKSGSGWQTRINEELRKVAGI